MKYLLVSALSLALATASPVSRLQAQDSAGLVFDAEQIVPSDTLTLRVTEWLPVEGEVRAWGAFSETFAVSRQGTIDLPFIGPVEAAGKSRQDLTRDIAQEILQRFALAEEPGVQLTFASRLPVTVGGVVRDPGAFDYEPGSTPRRLFARAGGVGLFQSSNDSVLRDMLQATSELEILRTREDTLAARVARLVAERADRDSIDFPLLQQPAGGEAIRAQERDLLRMNRDKSARALELIDGREEFLTAEVSSLEAKLDVLERQRQMAEEQKDSVKELADRGLTVNTRLLDAERTLATLETQKLDTTTTILEARQALSAAQSERLELVQGRAAQLLADQQTAEAELAEVRENRRLKERLTVSMQASTRPDELLGVTVRRAAPDGKEEVFEDALDMPVRPGDFIEFSLRLPNQEG